MSSLVSSSVDLQKHQISEAYTDLDSLRKIKSEDDKDQALKKVAKQFESLFLHELLKNMRKANAVFEENSLFDSKETNFYRDMYDQQLSLTLAQQGTGLSEMLYQQMSHRYGPSLERSEAEPTKGETSVDRGQAERIPETLPLENTDVATVVRAGQADFQQSNKGPEVKVEAPMMVKTVSKENQSFEFSRAQTEKGKEKLVEWGKSLSFDSPKDFVGSLLPVAEKIAKSNGFNPLIVLAQAALETGWGKHILKDQNGTSNNLFNIKAGPGWKGEKVTVNTLEYRDGLPVQEKANFRKYDSIGQSLLDYFQFISDSPRYQKAVESSTDSQKYIEELSKAGYATDPNYSEKVMSVLQRLQSHLLPTQPKTEAPGVSYVQ